MSKFFLSVLTSLALSACAHVDATGDNHMTIQGGEKVDRDLIRNVFIKKEPDITACYQQALNVHQELQGKLTLDLSITNKGHVVNTGINDAQSTIVGPARDRLTKCLFPRIQSWKFPENPKGKDLISIQYPLELHKPKK